MYRLRKVSNKSIDLLQREAVTAHKKERPERALRGQTPDDYRSIKSTRVLYTLGNNIDTANQPMFQSVQLYGSANQTATDGFLPKQISGSLEPQLNKGSGSVTEDVRSAHGSEYYSSVKRKLMTDPQADNTIEVLQ